MRAPDTVLQEVWQIKNEAFRQAGNDPVHFVQALKASSLALREGLGLISGLKPASNAKPAPTACSTKD